MNRWALPSVAVFAVVVFLLSALPVGFGAGSPAAPSGATNAGAAIPPINASDTVLLPGGYPFHVPGGAAGLAADMKGGGLAPVLSSGAALKAGLATTYGAGLTPTIDLLPSSLWVGLVAGAADYRAGHDSQGAAAIRDALTVGDYLGISDVAAITIIAFACTVGELTIIGCAVGLLVVGLWISVGLLAYCFTYGFSSCTGNNPERLDAQNEVNKIMGGLRQVAENLANSTETILNDLNATYFALTWEAANAALTQIGNGTFNVNLNAFQSGILPQMVSTETGVIANLANAVASTLNGTAAIFGPTGFYGQQGIACIVTVGQGGASFVPGGTGQYEVTDPNLYSGFSPQAPACYGETGTPGNEAWSGTANPSVFPGVYPGVRLSYGDASRDEGTTSEYYLAKGASIDAAFVSSTVTAPLTPTTGPYVGIQLIPTAGTGTTWFNFTTGNAAFNMSIPNGTYYVNQVAGCTTLSFSSCHSIGSGVEPAVLVATEAFPLTAGTADVTALAASFNLTGPFSGDTSNSVPLACSTPALGLYAVAVAPETDSETFGLCNGPTNNTVVTLETLLTASTTVGDAYWLFLRSAGYTSVAQIPTRCIIPNPASIISPNLNGGAAYLASLTPTQLTALYTNYLARLAGTFNNSSANLIYLNFCGIKIACPPLTGTPTCFSAVGGGTVPVLAIGSIYVPPAECASDFNATCHGESIGNYKTWFLRNVTMLWEPSTGTFTAVLNQTMALPHANPMDLMYSTNESAGMNLTCQTGSFNVYSCVPSNRTPAWLIEQFAYHVTGNSTVNSGSVYPSSVNPAFGAGWATRVTACATVDLANFSGNWAQGQNYTWQHVSCSFNETQIRSWITNDSCTFDTSSCGVCPPDCNGGGGSGSSCGGSIPFLSGVVNSIYGLLGNLLGFGCGLAWLLGLILIVIVVAIVAVVALAVYRGLSGGRRSSSTEG
jgi:hypothetical protein